MERGKCAPYSPPPRPSPRLLPAAGPGPGGDGGDTTVDGEEEEDGEETASCRSRGGGRLREEGGMFMGCRAREERGTAGGRPGGAARRPNSPPYSV